MRDRKRLFIAIDVSKEAKEFFRYFKDRWYDFPGRWVQHDILHITLSFLGQVREEDLPIIIKSIESAANGISPFSVKLENVDFDDTRGKKPKKIVVRIGDNENLQNLYRCVSGQLSQMPFGIHSQRPLFSPHITLCRFNSISLQKWHSNELPSVAEEVNISFPVGSIHLMESKLRRGGPEYFVLQSFSLGA